MNIKTCVQKFSTGISRNQRKLPRYIVIGILPWSLPCLLAMLLCYFFIQTSPPFGFSLANIEVPPPLVTQEIRYYAPEAGEVFLIWGINGWTVVSEVIRPAGTVVKNAVMHTPMVRQGATFVAKVQVPASAMIDYGFLITKDRNGADIEAVWEAYGDQDHNTIATQDGIVEVQTALTLAQEQVPSSVANLELSLLIGLSFVFATGTIFIIRRHFTLISYKVPFRSRRLIYLRDLLRELISRDMKLRYKRSVLGIAWSLLNPLAQLLIFYFVFSLILPLNIPNYAIFLFTGILVWTWFQTSLLTATGAIVNNPELIRRPGFPVTILPVVTVMTHLIHFLLALPVLLLFLIFNDDIQLTYAILALPLVVVLQFTLTLSLAYLVATIHVIFRDTQYLLGIFLLLGFYLSPIFYDTSLIPSKYQLLYRLNPMVDLIHAYRAILMKGELPNFLPLLVLGVFATGLLWLGNRIFMRTSFRFVEEL